MTLVKEKMKSTASNCCYIIFLLSQILTCVNGQSDCIQLTGDQVELTPNISILEDINQEYNFDAIKNGRFSFIDINEITFKNTTYWGRIKLCNSNQQTQWSFRVNRNTLSHFNIHFYNNRKSTWETKNSGAFQPYEEQDGYFPLQSDYNHVDITLDSNEEAEILFYFRNNRKYAVPKISVSIIPKDAAFYESLNSWKSRTFLVAGLFLFLIILGATFYFNTRDKAFLFYGLYLSSLLIWIFFSAGMFDDWLSKNIFPQHPERSRMIGSVIICYWFYISFIWHFGNISKAYTWGKKYIVIWSAYIAIFVPILIVGHLTTKNMQIFFKIGLVFNFGMALFTIRVILLLWNRKKETDIRYAIIGFVLMLSLLIIASYEIVMNNFQIPEFSIISVIFISEIVFFLWALSQRYKNFLQFEVENQIIEQSLKEKDTLLREIHHRVKNNLQVISALLTLQSKYVSDDKAKDALKVGEGRVQSMALIHQDLYQHDNLKGVNVKDYIENLVKNLIDSYKTEKLVISLHSDIQPIFLDVDTMIPLGLVVNEIVSNALKHAFTNKIEGNIYITLQENLDALQLKIRDDGIGTSVVDLEGKSFGFSLIKSFARRLNAKVDVVNQDGLSILMEINNYKKVA